MTRLTTMSALALAVAVGPAFGQVSQEELDAISIPDMVETAIGTLEFFDGVPTDATISTVYDNLDRMRGTDVFLDNIGAVSMYSVRKGLADAGAEGANKIALFAQLLDSQTLVVTANTSTLYAYTYTDLAKDGPTVIEVPPGCSAFSTMRGSVSTAIWASPGRTKARAENILSYLPAMSATFLTDTSS